MAFYTIQLLFVVFPDLCGLPCSFLLLKGFFLALFQMSGATGTALHQGFQWKGQSFESNRDRLAAYALSRTSHSSARRPLVASIVEAILMGPMETISIRVARLLAEQHLIATNLENLRIAGDRFVRNLVDSNCDAGRLRTILADIVEFDDKLEHASECSKRMLKVVIDQLAAELSLLRSMTLVRWRVRCDDAFLFPVFVSEDWECSDYLPMNIAANLSSTTELPGLDVPRYVLLLSE